MTVGFLGPGPRVAELGKCLAVGTTQLEAGEAAAGGAQASAGASVGGYSVVSNGDPSKDSELFAFRSEIAAAQQQQMVQPQARASALRPILTLFALFGILGILAVLALPMLLPKPKPPALYVDLGNRRSDPAGLAGRMIVRWEGSSAKYQLYIDPLDQEQAAGFQSLAVNPSHPLSVVVQLLDSTDVVACQKEIVFPLPALAGTPFDPSQVLMPKSTPSGDTVQNVAGSDGKVAEITVSGPLPCSLSAYQHLSGWEFNSNFPTVAEQKGSLRHAAGSDFAADASKRHSSSSWRSPSPAIQRLNAPIEGDDVIVGDNYAKGTVDTSSGRVFLVGAATWQTRSADWQIFPAAIHFHCEKTGACVLTRVSSRTILQAHLMK